MRGAFTSSDAAAAGQTLAAYALGLLPFVLIRSVVATFLARGDTATPVRAALIAAAVNIAFKIIFYSATSLAQIGLAFATSIGAWLNFALVLWFAHRRGRIQLDGKLARQVGRVALAAAVLALALDLAKGRVAALFSAWPRWGDGAMLATLAVIGGLVYGGTLLALYRPRWLAALRSRAGAPPAAQ